MASAADSTRLAVLIDGDNTTPTIIEALLAEIAKYGSATVKRAYGVGSYVAKQAPDFDSRNWGYTKRTAATSTRS